MNKQPAEIIGKITSLVEKLLVGNFADGISDWTVVDDRRLTAETAFNMAIQTVVARVQLTTNEPETRENCVRIRAFTTLLPSSLTSHDSRIIKDFQFHYNSNIISHIAIKRSTNLARLSHVCQYLT